MKVLIVFLGTLLMCISCLTYQADAIAYKHDVVLLKEMADEAACQAGLCVDEEAYGIGDYRFAYARATQYAEQYVAARQSALKAKLIGDIACKISFEDDVKGYENSNREQKPAVTVRLTADTEDMFRLAVLKKEKILASSRYEIEAFGAE